MMRKTGKLFLIFGMIICVLLGTGCSKKGSPIKIKAIPKDYYTIGEPLELSLKFGHSYTFKSDDDRLGKSIAIVKISHPVIKGDTTIIPDDLVNGETLLEIKDFLTTKYAVSKYSVGNCNSFRYNNSAKIEIPQKYIVKNIGCLLLTFSYHYLDANGNIKEGGYSESISITYRILDNNIYLEL